MNDIERFWSKVDVCNKTECWPWLAQLNHRGYGVFWYAGKSVRANRYALEITKGPPPYDDAMALHSCDNPPCCNPNHLRWGSAKDNATDFILRKGPRHGERSSRATVTNDIVDTIYQMRLDGYKIKEISSFLNIEKTTVENIYTGASWSHRLGVDGNPTLDELRAKRKHRNPRKAPNARLSDANVDFIIRSRMEGRKATEIANDLGLPLGTISPVFCGLSHTHRLGVDGNPTLDQLKQTRSVSKNLKLTDDDVAEIRQMLAEGAWGADLARMFGVSRATISNIKNGKARTNS